MTWIRLGEAIEGVMENCLRAQGVAEIATVTSDDVVRACAEAFDVTPSAIRSRCQVGLVAAARHTAWALLKERGFSVRQIADDFERETATVYSGLRRFDSAMMYRHTSLIRSRVDAARHNLSEAMAERGRG